MHALLNAIPASVEVLKLTRQWIKVCDVECLGLAMHRLTCLRVLDLSENYLNSAGCSFILSNVSSTSIDSIALGFNHIKTGLHRQCDHLGLDRFTLKHLDLKHNLINFNYMDSILNCVKVSAGVIEELDLSQNDLRVKGVLILSRELEKCSRLRRLVLAGNRMQNEGFCLLMCVVSPPSCKSAGVGGGIALHSLDVSNNELTENSAGIFEHCMKNNLKLQKSLCEVSFSNNYFYDVGVKMIVKTLRPYPVSKLCLARTRLGESAAETLASAMQLWPNLRFLDVTGNLMRDTCLLLIAISMCNKSTKNRELYIRGNYKLHNNTSEHLHTMLSNNHIKHDTVAECGS
jgi:Ran GTPase-activating protein (RanGAP) involved in mRNA processing and transport